jgi:uncharacterized membrane protein
LPAARALLLAIFGLVALGIVGPPLLEQSGGAAAGGALRPLFALVCHQRPERSLWIGQVPLAVCQRCSGIYLGLLLGAALPVSGLRLLCGARRRVWALAGLAPVLADVGLGVAGVWRGSPATRFGSGLVAGIMLATLAVAGLAEFVAALPRVSGSALRHSTAPRSSR